MRFPMSARPWAGSSEMATSAGKPVQGLDLLSQAIEHLESDASFALRIQTSEPVLVRDVMASLGAVRDDELMSPTKSSAMVLAPYVFGTLRLQDEPPSAHFNINNAYTNAAMAGPSLHPSHLRASCFMARSYLLQAHA